MSSNSHKIYQSILLHAHLPYVRHPEHPKFFEENWLFEAISECYLPLIEMLHEVENKGIRGKITLTLTPTLTAMLSDDLLLSRYSARLADLVKLSKLETLKHSNNPEYKVVTEFYFKLFSRLQILFEEEYNRDLINEFKLLRSKGRIEVIGCAATHALLALSDDKRVIKSQIYTGVRAYEDTFGELPRGIWMPECAYTPLVSEVIKEAGCEYSIVDSHGILHADPMPKYSVFSPVRDVNDLILFGRDPESSKQVWSADTGYPGDYNYREFYRDLGWDEDEEYIGPYLVAPDIRHDLGLKYHRITGNTSIEHKAIYDPKVAQETAISHGRHFVDSRISQGNRLIAQCNNSVHILSPYDAELFGHWWFEGPNFLKSLIEYSSESELELVTPSDYLDITTEIQKVDVSISSWGNNGYFETWLNGNNDWIYDGLRNAEDKMQRLCHLYPKEKISEEEHRALQQAGRELLLAQSSDWAFILTSETTSEYATKRVRDHLSNFMTINTMLKTKNIDINFIDSLFYNNNIFPDIDYTVFS